MSIQNNFSFQQATPTNSSLGFMLPEGILRQGLMSDSSEAINCFVYQQFSAKLQAYMLNYVIATSSYYPLYG